MVAITLEDRTDNIKDFNLGYVMEYIKETM